MDISDQASGLVLQIQRMSTEDGPGLRTTAFLKGCPLACAWCHNPESISPRPEVQWIGLRCIGCGSCIAACPRKALSRAADGAVTVDRSLCAQAMGPGDCGLCCSACPTGAMEALGTRYAAAELAAELLKDLSYFRHSDRGGVTLSGGEASAQGTFTKAVFSLLREKGVHTALDTCGFASWDNISAIYPDANLLLWDLKEIDESKHREFTGQGNRLIMENFEKTAAYMRERPMPESLWIRTPIIPGATDREENLYELGRLVARVNPPRLERWELCAFNNLCADKYRRLGKDWDFSKKPLMTTLEMERLVAAAKRGLADGRLGAPAPILPDIVSWTGSTRIEPERN
jgi:pyruvate formate lyase activating enzyme